MESKTLAPLCEKSMWDALCIGDQYNLWLTNEQIDKVDFRNQQLIAEDWFF